MHVVWRKTLPSKFSVQESYATPIPMYNLGNGNTIRSKIFYSLYFVKSADSRGYVDVNDINFITNLWNLIEILEF